MQQRKSAFGRPSGTDGSDFSYRMVVDSRYQKLAKGKSRLYALIFIQVIQDRSNWEKYKFKLLETVLILIAITGLLIQIFTIGTTISLISNMSPPKRAS